MLESVVGQWAGSTKKAKCTIVVYSIDEFIPSQLSGRPHSQLGRCYILSAGLPGRPGHDPTAGAAGVLGALVRTIFKHFHSRSMNSDMPIYMY
jgi:hypothetical protein